MSRRWSTGVLVLLLVLALRTPAAGASVDYLYVEPDVGDSAGGHAALRLGDAVYHFRNADGGMLRLARDDWEYFRWQYSVRQNRPIHVARLRASEDTAARLRDAFDRRYLVERKHFATLDSIEGDVRLLGNLIACERSCDCDAERGLRLRGAGYFFDGTAAGPPSPALLALRSRVLAANGRTFLEDRIAMLERALADPDLGSRPFAPTVVAGDAYPQPVYTRSDRRTDLALELLALRVLDEARAVRPDAIRVPDGLDLSRAERAALADYARRLGDDALRLLASSRRDRGYPLLVLMARADVLATSIASGHLVVPDTFPDGARAVDAATFRRSDALVEEVRIRAERHLAAARARLTTDTPLDESQVRALEEAVNRRDEIERGVRDGRDVRIHSGLLVPERAAFAISLPRPAADRDELAAAAKDAEATARTYASRLRDVFGYRLTERNCVSEIFAVIDATFGREGSSERLGGHVDPLQALGYIPAVSYRRVLATYDLAADGIVPSYRDEHLARLYASESPALVYLREASTLTSTIYRPNDRDAFFLFFTDDAVLPRPLLGAANLAAGVGETAIGLVRAPLDRGRTLWAGLQGIVFSLPELAFVSFRKGTLAYPPDDLPRTELRLSPHATAADASS